MNTANGEVFDSRVVALDAVGGLAGAVAGFTLAVWEKNYLFHGIQAQNAANTVSDLQSNLSTAQQTEVMFRNEPSQLRTQVDKIADHDISVDRTKINTTIAHSPPFGGLQRAETAGLGFTEVIVFGALGAVAVLQARRAIHNHRVKASQAEQTRPTTSDDSTTEVLA